MLVTARHWCWDAHETFLLPATVGPTAQTIHLSVSRCASRPFAVFGRLLYDVLWSPPPTMSHRYQRAPSSHAFCEGRNHAQLTIARITMLSSAPRNRWNFELQVR